MSTDATTPSTATSNGSIPEPTLSPTSKGKGKQVQVREDVMDEDEEGDEDEEDEEEDEDEEMAEEEDFEEIDPSVITGRRTRGVRVDYTSPEALAKAGLKPDDEDDENEDSFVAKDDDMRD
ncbi:hypothetical protein C8Q80DRAFT_1184923 [Daedaleopsis nitida]|nr:hypothetical protein C8Q80DRAFT_1184923 [Daedaleopsis nitida]